MLDYKELEELLEKIKEQIEEKVLLANRCGTLEELLNKWDFSDCIYSDSYYETDKYGKILVIGESRVKEKDLKGVIKSLELDINRFEFCLEYNEAKKYDYKKLQYNPDYRVVLFGPVPHSSSGKSDSSSVITNMKKKEGYPRVVNLSSNLELKITKSNFKEALIKLEKENYI